MSTKACCDSSELRYNEIQEDLQDICCTEGVTDQVYRRRMERRRKLLQSVIRWHPLLILMIMFILGACSRTKPAGYTITTAAQTVEQTAEVTTAAFSLVEETTPAAKPKPADPSAEGLQETVEAVPDSEPETAAAWAETTEQETTAAGLTVSENGNYTSKDEVALYIHLYGHLPSNYITKRKAEDRGWDSKKGNLGNVLPGMSIGGSTFGNYEGLLPAKKGRKYYECDIDYEGGYRNAKRIIYSNDGLVFYTEDHYKSFEQLY